MDQLQPRCSSACLIDTHTHLLATLACVCWFVFQLSVLTVCMYAMTKITINYVPVVFLYHLAPSSDLTCHKKASRAGNIHTYVNGTSEVGIALD